MPSRLASPWDDERARSMSEPERLLYRSNLLGSDLRVTNFGGGNTSAKVMQRDPLTGLEVEVLWVKGSGGDLGSMKLDGFATLYMSKLEQLKQLYRGAAHEDEMVAYLPHCTFNLNPRAASIDTPLHAFVPYRHVDHMHPDALTAIAAAARSRDLTAEVFGGKIGWLPWQRPGFDLGLKIGAFAKEHPEAQGAVLAGHGLFTWADTAKACYELTLRIIQLSADYLASRQSRDALGGRRTAALPPERRLAVAQAIMPLLRGKISGREPKVGHFDDGPQVLEFVCSRDLAPLAALGTSCPDHFLRTKIRPLVLDFDPEKGRVEQLLASIDEKLEAYRKDYAGYYDRCRRPDSPSMRDPNAVVYLVPGVGMLSFARDKATARIAGEYYVNAINVIRGASSVDRYVGLPEQEAFDIEYWLLEEAKLQRMPKPKSLAGRIAFITGGAGGIGRATALRLLAEGACVTLADLDAGSLQQAVADLAGSFGKDVVHGVAVNVVDEAAVEAAFGDATRRFGGLDIVVSNAGIASAAAVEETTLDLWRKNIDVLATGYFLIARTGYRLLKAQGRGGSIVFVGSKNALAASAGASAYCTAKAGAGGSSARDPGQRGQPGCSHPRIQDLVGIVEGGARGRQQDRYRRRRGVLPQAQPAAAQRVSGGRRRGHLLLRFRGIREVHRQHPQRRRWQRNGVHPLTSGAAIRYSRGTAGARA
jgi:rhamnulose-1-phosphate aldolase/alcohol dehydrogenase